MRRNGIIIFITVIVLCLSGCGKRTQDAEVFSETDKENGEWNLDSGIMDETDSPLDEEKDSFVFRYRDVCETIYLEDCQCEYDKDGIRVYSKYITGHFDKEGFPRYQYILYVMSPYAGWQLFPVKDFQICEESDAIYLVRAREEFESLQKIGLGNYSISTEDLEDGISMEQRIIDAHKIPENLETDVDETTPLLSDLHFEFEGHGEYGETMKVPAGWQEPRQCSTLKGYASGIERMTGKKFYINYEWDESAGEGIVNPCILRVYDPQTDVEDFQKCQEAFEQIMQGDWSGVTPMEGMEYMWGMSGEDWRQADVNGDGLPELIGQVDNSVKDKNPISLIFTWDGEKVDLVYIDLIDWTEFLFLTDEGQLIYEWSTSGTPKRTQFSKYHFDEKWNLAFEEILEDESNIWFWEEEFQETLTEEKLFDYEIRIDDRGEKYAIINGYQDEFAKNWHRLRKYWTSSFPEQLEGVTVTGFADCAFQNVPLGDYSKSLEISPDIVFIGENCFENCGLTNVNFVKENLEESISVNTLTVCDGAFAKNPELWGIYFNDRKTVLGEAVFGECAEKVYLCYRKGTEEQADYLKKYALENQVNAVEIPTYYSETPLVEYQEAPFVLMPEVRNFFYGENAWSEDEDIFCSFEYDDEAPDYGFPEWHLPCGEFCAMTEGTYDITASSELSPTDGRYAPKHLSSAYGREHAWAEGVEGNGIGESISIVSCCSYQYSQDGYSEGNVSFLDGDIEPDIYDGYMRYTEICVVNGYAKNQTVWEENGRVKRLLMYVEDKPYACLELEDTIYPQYFTLPVDAIKAADGVDIHFQFVIEDVYPGTKYEDTCLTGLVVEFMGRRGH